MMSKEVNIYKTFFLFLSRIKVQFSAKVIQSSLPEVNSPVLSLWLLLLLKENL